MDTTTVRGGILGASAGTKLVGSIGLGVVALVVTGFVGSWSYATVVGWGVTSLVWTAGAWLAIAPMDADDTASHALREDPSRGASDALLLAANLASLAAVGVVLVQARHGHGVREGVMAGLAVASVALSWLMVHTLFTLGYARLYYGDHTGGIDFNQRERPRYLDFAYVAFSVGMTFQISDTNIQRSVIRAAVLRHALLSYVFGSVILATTINLVVGLSS